MPEEVRARLLFSTAALPRWPALSGASGPLLAWHPFTPGYADRLVFTAPGGTYRPALRPDDGYPYPIGWTHLDLHERSPGEWVSTVLPFPAEGYPPIVQPVAASEWLVYDIPHIRLVAADGAKHATFRSGPVHCLQATSTGRAWIGYGEEQILSSDIGSACFAAFERDGTRIFSYLDVATQKGLLIPLNVNALNLVDDAETWMLGTGEDSILMRVNDLAIAETWVWSNRGSLESHGPYGFGLAVDGQRRRVLTSIGQAPEVKLWDLNTKQPTPLIALGESGPLDVQRTAGRGPLLYLTTWDALYALDVRDLG